MERLLNKIFLFWKPERYRLPPMSTLHWFDFECDKDKTLRTLDFIPKCQLWWCRIVDGGDTTGAVHLFQTMERIQQMDGRNRNIKWKYVSAHKAIICQSKTNKIAIIMESKENISTLMWEWELLPLALLPWSPDPHHTDAAESVKRPFPNDVFIPWRCQQFVCGKVSKLAVR